MTHQEQVQDALIRVANLRRSLNMARAVRESSFHMATVTDVVVALARQLQAAEAEATRLIGPTGHTFDNGGHIHVSRDDRRQAPRPRFGYRHSHAMTVTA